MDWFADLEADGHSSPLSNAPELYDDLLQYWEAFDSLSGSRQISASGMGYVFHSEITDYLNENLIFDFYERKEYRYFINFIDAEYIRIQSEKQAKHMKSARKKNRR